VQSKQFVFAGVLLAFLVATPAQRRALRAARLRKDNDCHGHFQSGAERKSESEIAHHDQSSQPNRVLFGSSETQVASQSAAREFHVLAGHLSVPVTCHLLLDFAWHYESELE
jgi:hypothetical protein